MQIETKSNVENNNISVNTASSYSLQKKTKNKVENNSIPVNTASSSDCSLCALTEGGPLYPRWGDSSCVFYKLNVLMVRQKYRHS